MSGTSNLDLDKDLKKITNMVSTVDLETMFNVIALLCPLA